MSTRSFLSGSLLLIAALCIYTFAVYSALPAMLPIHWDLHGEINGWVAKQTAVLFGLTMPTVTVLFTLFVETLSPGFRVASFRATFNQILFATVVFFGYVYLLILQAGLHPQMNSGRAMFGGILLFFAIIGNLMGKIRPNPWAGIRTPWTLASEQVWVATHRLAARLYVAASLVGIVALLFNVPMAVISVGWGVALIYPVIYSFLAARQGPAGPISLLLCLLAGMAICGTGQAQQAPINSKIQATAGAKVVNSIEQEITFAGAGGLEIKGTLLLPASSAGRKRPAMLLLAGSGPTGRDGGIAGAAGDGILKQIADRLASIGIATLRYDKRAMASVYAEKFPKDAAGLNQFFSWNSFVTDAENGLAFLRTQPDIDAERVGILGHSEGGMIAIQVGSRSSEKTRPAALVLVSTPGRTLEPVIAEQLDFGIQNALKAGLMNKPVADDLRRDYKRAVTSIVQNGVVPGDLAPALAPIFPAYAPDLMKAYLTTDNARDAARYPGPVLVIQGEKDIQISATKDAPALEKALKARKKGEAAVFIVPSASHNLRVVGDVTREPGFAGPVAPEALAKIADWLTTTLKP